MEDQSDPYLKKSGHQSMPRDTELTSIKDDGQVPSTLKRHPNAYETLLSRVDRVLESAKKVTHDNPRKSLFFDRIG
jgi:hypothetical protein